MIYNIKQHLVEEGVLEHVKNNIGKYALVGAGLAAAGAGELGSSAEHLATSAGHAAEVAGHKLSDIGHKTLDHYSGNSDATHSTEANANANANEMTKEEWEHQKVAEDTKIAREKSIQAKLNAPRTSLEHHTFHDTNVSIDKNGQIDYDRHLNTTGVDTAAAAGVGASLFGISKARRRDKRRMQASFNRGKASR